MKKKNIRILFLIIIFIFISSFLFLYEKINNFLLKNQVAQPLAKIKENKIIKIVFENENNKTEVYKKNSHWYLVKDGFELKADEERINKTIDALINIKKEEIVSQNKNKHKDFGIDKRKITIYTEKNKFIIYVGNNANLANNYIRINNENTVFLAENLSDVFSNNNDWWDSKVDFVSNPEKIKSIEINYLSEEKKIILTKNKNEWIINGKKAKKDRVDFFINDLKTLKADDITSKENFYDINPEIVIIVNEDNKIKKGDFFNIDKEYYFLTINKNKFIYKIKTAYISFLKKEEDDFIQ